MCARNRIKPKKYLQTIKAMIEILMVPEKVVIYFSDLHAETMVLSFRKKENYFRKWIMWYLKSSDEFTIFPTALEI